MNHYEKQAQIAEVKQKLLEGMDAYVIAIGKKSTRDVIELRFAEIEKWKRELRLLEYFD